MDLCCKIYLVDKEPTMPGPILGSKPPSVEQVFLKFRGNHKMLQEKSGGRSSIHEAATLTAHEVHEWWSQTGIQVKKENPLVYMIEAIQKKWTILHKQRAKDTKIQHENRVKFLQSLKSIFWAVSPDYEKVLQNSTDPRKVEDRKWLVSFKTTGEGSLGRMDKKFEKGKMRIQQRELAFQKKFSIKNNISQVPDPERDVDDEADGSNYVLPSTPKSRTKRINALTPEVCVVADKHKLSHRAVTELFGAAIIGNYFRCAICYLHNGNL